MKKLPTIFITWLLLATSGVYAINETKTVGSTGADYSTLKAAIDAINAGTLTGNITLQIIGSTTEPASGNTASLSASGTGSASYTSLLIYPTIAGCTINCSNSNGWPVLLLNGADHVTIDGRVNQTGTSPSLILSNSVRQAVLFQNGARNNVIKFCTLKGSYNGTSTAGVISFNNTGGGNKDNIIEYCNITNGGTRMCEALRSEGAAGHVNSGNIIRNNNFYDIFSTTANAKEVLYLGNYNENWTIQGNSFYETTDLIPGGSGEYKFIAITGSSTTGLFNISGNYLGGTAPQCGGTALTKTDANTNVLTVISLSAAAGCTISIQGNVIRNIAWSNAGAAYGYLIGASQGCTLNIGTESGNIFGDTVGSGSISYTNGGDTQGLYCIYANTSGETNISNNFFGSLKTNNSNPAYRTDLFVIFKGDYPGNVTVSNNRIGSTDPGTSNSIWASSASTSSNQYLIGINSESETANWTITGNTFSKAMNASTATLSILDFVLFSTGATNIITSNVVTDLTCSSSSTGSSWQTSVCGINLSGGFSGTQTISGNVLFNLVNTNPTFAGSVIGISCEGTVPSAPVISGNYIHSLDATGASLGAAKLIGIKAGGNSVNAYNNLVVLGNNSSTEITGFFDSGGTQARTYFFNTAYIYGSSGSATQNSMAFRCSPGSGAKDFRNNVFVNSRSGLSGSYHYAYYISHSNGTLTSDYNDYYVSGTGGTLGYFQYNRSTLALIQSGTGGDTHSLNVDPAFVNAGSLADTGYRLTNDLVGITGTGITTDYEGISRTASPTMGAFQWNPVTTQAVSSVTTESATGNGTITKTGSYTTRGAIVYAYTNTDKIIGDPGVTNSANTGSFSAGPFTANFTGLSVNTRYNTRAHTTKAGVTYYGTRVDFRTLANVPSSPIVNNPMATSLDVTVNVNSNPAATEFCINETSTGQFVQANGKLGAAEVWKTAAEWGTKRVSGLILGNTYTFKVKARNGDNVETDYSNTASGTTSAMPVIRTGIITWQEGNHYDDATVWDVLAFAGDGQTAFAGGYYASTYRYSGGVWSPTTTTPVSAMMQNMAISNDGSIALAGGDYTMNLFSSGSWASTPVPGINSYVWPCIAVAGDGSKLLAGARNGRMYIKNGGSWIETQPAGAADKYWTAADMSDDGSVIIAAIGYNDVFPPIAGRVYLSADGGTTWSEIRPDGDADQVWKSVSVSRDGNVLFAVYQGSNNVYRSDDGGATWTSDNPNPLYGASINWRKIDASWDGNEIAASDYNGPLYYYSYGAWSKDFAPISCCSGDISMTADGERMIVSNNSRTYMSFYGDAISDITFTSAIAHGTVTEIGGPAATQHGFVWSSTVTEPTIDLTTKTEAGPITQTGTFQSQATGLTPNTLYYIRAYATSANGTVYGDVTTFRTGTYIYVDQAKTSGANNGTSWTDAYLELYSALDAAGEGDQIWVAKGTYKPKPGSSPRDSSFVIPNGIQVYGGFAGNETNLEDRDWTNNVTILSGDIGTAGTNTDNVYHVVRFSAANTVTILSGCTVTKGYADGGSALDEDYPGNSGGGIYIDGSGAGNSSKPIIVDCIISHNYANYQGGGVHNEANAGRTIETAGEASSIFMNCTFTQNTSGNYGGAVQNTGYEGKSSPMFFDCDFSYNSGKNGGAVHTLSVNDTCAPMFISCSFSSNSSSNAGGALRFKTEGGLTNPLIRLSAFNGNTSKIGGAIYNISYYAGVANGTIDSCTFTGNSATLDAGAVMNEVYDAGGVSSPSITNCTFTNNTCSTVDGKGGAILNQGYPGVSSPAISNCNFTSNAADRGGAICNYGRDDSGDDGISSPTISNCSFKGNSANGNSGYGGAVFNYGRSGGDVSPVLTNCLISGNVAKKGSAVFNNDGSAEFINCTMSGNYATVSGTFYSARYTNSSDPQISNCIIWHNNDLAVVNGTDGNPIFHYSDIEGSGGSSSWNSSFGTDVGYNIDSDPVFASRIILTSNPTTAGDLRLTASSPCADAGQDSYITELFDIRGAGFSRFLLKTDSTQTGPVDMGVYEYKQGFDPLSPAPSLLTAAVTNITTSGGDCGGLSIQDNGAPITEKGIVWGFDPTPVITGNKLISNPADTSAFTLTIAAIPVSTTLYVRAFATNAGGTAYGEEKVFSTLANVPSAPTVANLNPGMLTVAVNPNGNSVTTEFAIRENGGNFVQADGSLGATEIWRTMAEWGIKTIIGLNAGVEYGFSTKARNGDLTETTYSDTAYGTPVDVPSMKWVTKGIGSWTEVQPAGDINGNWYVAVSENGLTVVAANNGGRAYISTNSGTNWEEIQPAGDMWMSWEMPSISYSGDTILLPSQKRNQAPLIGRIYMSVDKGVTWSTLAPAGVTDDLNWKYAGMSFDGSYMLVSSSGTSGNNGTYRSSDGGSTWTKLTSIFYTLESAIGFDLSPTGEVQIIGGNARMYQSTDFGGTWGVISHLPVYKNWERPDMSNDAQTIAVANSTEKRLYKSINAGTDWSEMQPAGDVSLNWKQVTISGDASFMVSGVNGGRLYFSCDGGTTWTETRPAGDVNKSWLSLALSNDGTQAYAGISSGRLYKAVMSVFNPVTDVTASATGEIVSSNGDSPTVRGTIYYPYTDTDKRLNDDGVLYTSESGTFTTGTYPVEATELNPGTHYNARAYGTNSVGTGYSERTDFWTLTVIPSAPVVDNPSAHTLDVTIAADSNTAETEYAIYDTVTAKYVQANGTLDNNAAWQTIANWGTKTVTGLVTGGIYHFKVKSRNGNLDETPFGPGTSDTTIATPSVSTQAATSIAATMATGNARIDSVYSLTVNNRGLIIYPYTNTNKVIGDADVTNHDTSGVFGVGAFTRSLTGLVPNVRYNLRGHATNINGTSYGARMDFWTLANVPLPPFAGNATAVSLEVSVKTNGNSDATMYLIQDSVAGLYLQPNGSRTATLTWQTAAQWDTVTVTGLSTGVTYYFRVKARNGQNTETAWSFATGANTCSDPTNGGTIGTEQSICLTVVPDSLTSIAAPSNYGGNLEYQWQSSQEGEDAGFTDITGATAAGYQPPTMTDTTWFRRLARVSCKPDWNGAAISNVVKIACYPLPFKISGFAKYENNPKTPLSGLKILLRSENAIVDSVVTTNAGYYEFDNLTNGDFGLVVKSAHPSGQWQTWSGVNNTDYLLVSKHVAGTQLLPVNPPVVRTSASVKLPHPAINALDATAIRQAAKFPLTGFTYFDTVKWVFSGVDATQALDGITLQCADVVRDIRGLCTGDVNGTYVPPSGYKLAGPGLELVHRGVLPISDEIIFPVRVERAMELGAMTLYLDFDPSVMIVTNVTTVTTVTTVANNPELWYNVSDPTSNLKPETLNLNPSTLNTLAIGWMSPEPVSLAAGQAVILIHARLRDGTHPIRFTLNENPLSELANGEGEIIDGAILEMPEARANTTEISNEFILSVFPNPSKDVVHVDYMLCSEELVSFELTNSQGVTVLKTDRSSQPAGTHRESFDVSNLMPGVYMLKAAAGPAVSFRKVVVVR